MRKLLILWILLTPFVFNSQKAFAGAGQSAVVSPPAPIVIAPTQRAVTANGDTVAIREIVKEKDPCEKCECELQFTYTNLFWVVLAFLAICILLK